MTISQVPFFHFSLDIPQFVSFLIISFCCLNCSVVSFMLPSLFLFIDEEWRCYHNFMCTYYLYLLVTFNLYLSNLNGEVIIRAVMECFDCSDQVFLINWLTYFNSRIVLVTSLKPSYGSHHLRLTLNLTAVHKTGWLLYFSTSLMVQDLYVTLFVQKSISPSYYVTFLICMQSYQKWIILKPIYFTHRWDPYEYCHSS